MISLPRLIGPRPLGTSVRPGEIVAIDRGTEAVVGVNRYRLDEEPPLPQMVTWSS